MPVNRKLLRDESTEKVYLNNEVNALKNTLEGGRKDGLLGKSKRETNGVVSDEIADDMEEMVLRGEDFLSSMDKRKSKRMQSLSKVPIIRSWLPIDKESVRMANTLERTKQKGIRTSARRQDFTVLYQCAYHERFPPDEPAGLRRQISLDDLYVQSKIFVACCQTMVKLWEDIEKRTITFSRSMDIQAFVLEVVTFLMSTIELRSKYPGSLSNILECVSLTVNRTDQLCREPKEKLPIVFEATKEYLYMWKRACQKAERLMSSSMHDKLNLNKPFSFDIDKDAEDTFAESVIYLQNDRRSGGYSSSGVLDGAVEIGRHVFTHENISEKLPKLLEMPVYFTGHPSESNAGTIVRSNYEGGYGDIRCVQLLEPIAYHAAISVLNEPLATVLRSTSKVAVKCVRNKISEGRTCLRITREGRVWSKMKHRNILPLIGFWKGFSPSYGATSLSFITPWIDDGNLLDYLKRHRDVSPEQRLKYLRDVACALSFSKYLSLKLVIQVSHFVSTVHNYSEDGPVVHGDLKANNVLVQGDEALLCDFGISHLSDGITGFTTEASTPWRWQAPERLGKDRLKPTPHADMYSFGCVFYEVFTADLPWPNSDSLHSSSSPRSQNPLKQPERPPEIALDSHWKFVKACWKEEPSVRPTANVAYKELGQFMGMA